MVSRSAPSPVVDDKGVYVFYESGDMIAASLDGKLLWQIDLQAMYGSFENDSSGCRNSPEDCLTSGNAPHCYGQAVKIFLLE